MAMYMMKDTKLLMTSFTSMRKIYLVPNLELKEMITKGLEPGLHFLEEKKILGQEDCNVPIIK